MPRPLTVDLEAQAYVDIGALEPIALGKHLSLWTLETPDPLSDVLSEDYFINAAETGLHLFDRIEVTSSRDSERPEHATLVVVDINLTPQRIVVELLHAPSKRAK